MKKIKDFEALTNDEIAEELKNEMVYALKQFGLYSFDDKGPDEVMHMSKYDGILKTKSIKDVAYILNKFYDITKDKRRASSVISRLIFNLEYRDDFDDLWNYDKYEIFEY